MNAESRGEPKPLYLKVGESFKISPYLDNPRPKSIYLIIDEIPVHLDGVGDGTITFKKDTIYPPGYVNTPAGPINVDAQMIGNALVITPETAPVSFIISLKGDLDKLRGIGIELDIDGLHFEGIQTESINNILGLEEAEVDYFRWICPLPGLAIKELATPRQRKVLEATDQLPEFQALKTLNDEIEPLIGTLCFPNDPKAFERAEFKFINKA